ncbi:hypothetical protein N5V57_02075 [Escherichia coli]|uniref:hypothetical protein n=1 Tax=Escherichia coli TaxID=562 RepID=UPI0021B66062|nr:hypothetical protein [Escherichia coli]MCT7384137.1 hypothetical protein [Escherichia coli]
MSHADMNNCSGFNEAAAAFSWNSPKKAINPYLDPAEVAPVSALSNLITLYAADNEQEQLRREALSDQVWERYFFNESRDPVQREMEQDKFISRAKLAHEQQRFNPDMVILADVNAQPSHISRPLMQRIEYFSSLGRPKAYSRYLRETIKPCLERLEHVRDSQLGALLSPIGLVVTALAGVALVVWKYWQPINAFLGGVVEGFKAAAGPVSAAFEPLKPVFQWIGDKVQALWGWFTDLLTPVKSTSAELQSAAAMGRRFGEALAEGLNMVMHPLDSLKFGVSWLLEKLGIVSKEAAKAKLPESVTRQQPVTVNADGKVMMPSGGFPSWGYGFAGMYDSGGYIPRGQFGIVGENGPEIVNGPANVTSRRNTAALAAVVAGMMGVAAAPAELPPLHPLAFPAKGGEAMVSRAATVPPVQRIEAPTQIIIQTQPGQSAQDIAREVARQLDERERRLKAKARSNYSDQGGYDA